MALKNIQPHHERAAFLMVLGTPIEDIAEEVDRTKSTVYQWRREPVFRARLKEMYREMKDVAIEDYSMLIHDAVSYLRKALQQDEVNSHGIEAAKMVIEAFIEPGLNVEHGVDKLPNPKRIKALLRKIPRELYEAAQRENIE